VNFPFYVARRYFLSKKKQNFINIISIISMVAVAFGTCALVVVLSVFNGLEGFVRSLYNSFDPEILVKPVTGKSFEVNDSLINNLSALPGVAVVTEVIEDYAYVRYRDSEDIVTIKGVGQNFLQQERMKNSLVEGRLVLEEDGINYAILGRGVQYNLGIPSDNEFYALQLYYPKRGKVSGSIDPSKMVNRKIIMPGGVFAIEKNYDLNYIFVPLEFARELLNYEQRRTSLEIKTSADYKIRNVKATLEDALGEGFKVLDSDEQHSELLKVLKIEKLFVFLTFSFIIAVASFNIFFSLTMLAIDKKRDISVLYSMGATDRIIRRIFLANGAIISFTGALVGLLLGLSIVLIQQKFGLVSMGMVTSVIDAYPVEMKVSDFVYTGLSIIIITFLASLHPAKIATRYDFRESVK
jgi:lipoprotein-releasing system permease protein